MRKITLLMSVVVLVLLLSVSAYAESTASDVITVNVAVEPWIEISLIAPNPLDLEIDKASQTSGTVQVTVKCNTKWFLYAEPAWGNYSGRVGMIGGTWTSPRFPQYGPKAAYPGIDKTAVSGDTVVIEIDVFPENQSNEYLSPDEDGAFTINLLAVVVS